MSTVQQALFMVQAAGGGGSGLTIVQAPTKPDTAYTSVLETTLTAVTSGNHGVVAVYGDTALGAPTISDSAGGSWGSPVHSYAETVNNTTAYYYIRANITSGLTWVRATYSGDNFCGMGVVIVSGGTPSLDGTPGGTTQADSTSWDHAFTSTVADVLFVGIAAFSNSATATGTSPLVANAVADFLGYSRGLFPTAGSNTANFTLADTRSGAKSWIVVKGT